MAKQKNEATDLVPISNSPGAGGLSTVDPREAMREAQSGQTKMAPKIVSLKEAGARITGRLVGQGAPVEIEDAAGDARALSTWVFDCGGGVHLAVISSYQLDHELPSLIGKRVRVTLLGQVETRKGQRVKDYLIEEFLEA